MSDITIKELEDRLDEEADRRAISRSAMINAILVDWADAHPGHRPDAEENPPAA